MKNNQLLKLLALTVVISLSGTLQSCNKALQNLHFNLGMQTQTVTIKIPPSAAGDVYIGPVVSPYNVDSFIKAQTGQQLGISNISSVKVASCILTLDNPTTASNFGNFESCSALFSSNTNSTPYTMSITNNPAAYATTLSLPVDANAELKSYIGDVFTYNVEGKLRTATTDTLSCTMKITYNLVVQG
jgi:hypothetical protein